MDTHRFRTLTSLSLVVLDAFMTILAFIIAYILRLVIDFPAPAVGVDPLGAYIGLMLLQAVSVVAVMFFYRMYHIVRSRMDQFYAIFGAVSIGSLLAVAFSSIFFKNTAFEVDYPRATMVYSWVLAIGLVSFGRWAHQHIRTQLQVRGTGREQLLIVGTGDVARVVLQKIQWSPYLGYDVVGLVNGEESPPEVLGVPVLGRSDDLPELIEKFDVDEVIIALPSASHEELIRLIGLCQRGKVSIKVFPDVFEIMSAGVTVDDLGGLPMLTVRDVALRGWNLMLKRAVDIAGSMVALVIFSPLMMLVAFLIKLDSPGPVFFIQERVGLDGQPFPMIKFRSMRQDAETSGQWTVKDDPRRTRLGSIIRRLSVDELPQLINVLLGGMSLVGPRAEQPKYVEEFQRRIPRYMERHREKAGVTGWAQVNGLRGDTSIEERTKYDLWYIENWSLWLDIKIILRTLIRGWLDPSAY
ncbi:MAG TPA: undecaprenyl-phosphate glucose phosphotransferase [Anaerolineales bacterium]|nr:undecaprenyl-phosphate glucose phosphotransferase [Anaerolineales bacterium]HLB50057.1 undecaprenyl-phosphate glucose phosphotransferase [Anaerolineales bacterium]